MALWIQNVTDGDKGDDELHDYRLMLNERELCRFQHIRSHGAADCLRHAADALEALDGMVPSALMRQMMRAARRHAIKAQASEYAPETQPPHDAGEGGMQ